MTSSSQHSGSQPPSAYPPADRPEPLPATGQAELPAPARPHVLLVSDQPGWDRVGPIIRRLVVGLIDEAIRVSLVCDHDCPASVHLPGLQAAYSLQRQGYFDLFNTARRFDELAEYAQRSRPTCIHAVSASCLEVALSIKQILNIPLLVTVDTTEPATLAPVADVLAPDRVAAAMSDRIRDALLARRGAASRGGFVEVIRPGIYLQQRVRPPFEPGAPVSMLVLEPLARGRGFEPMLQAVADLLQDGINVMLFFIDAGPAEVQLRKHALRLQVHEHITFTGRFMRWPQTLGAADLVILPLPHPDLRIYPLEAMASGTLLVAAAGHCYDTITDGKTGLEFDPVRPHDLPGRLLRILKDPHQARSLAYAGQEKIRRDHSVSQMVNAYITLYTRLAAPPR